MNDLEQYFYDNTGRLIHKWRHYFEIYDRHFARFRGTAVTLVEIGVFHGGSLQMWKHYFGPAATIVGVDIDPACKSMEEEQIKILIGDQADRNFLRTLAQTLPRIDIVLDDGGHFMQQQITTFEELFPRIDPNGVYLCEDLHTSYWKRYGGGYRKSAASSNTART
jgi:23S rRNA U2552 (ribose-2'-O)-methylase RlmE/FtsJ